MSFADASSKVVEIDVEYHSKSAVNLKRPNVRPKAPAPEADGVNPIIPDAGPPGSKVEDSLDLGKAVKALQMSCSVRDESSVGEDLVSSRPPQLPEVGPAKAGSVECSYAGASQLSVHLGGPLIEAIPTGNGGSDSKHLETCDEEPPRADCPNFQSFVNESDAGPLPWQLALPDLQSVSVAGVLVDSCEVALVVNCEPLSEIDVHSSVGNADLGLTQISLPSPDIDSGISHGLRAVEDVALDGYVAEDRAHLLTAEPSDPPGSSPSLMRSDCSVEGHCLTIPGLGECGADLEELSASVSLQQPMPAAGVADESDVVVSIPNLSVEIDPKITPDSIVRIARKYGLESNSAGRAPPRLFDHLDENHPILSSGGFVDVVPNPPIVNQTPSGSDDVVPDEKDPLYLAFQQLMVSEVDAESNWWIAADAVMTFMWANALLSEAANAGGLAGLFGGAGCVAGSCCDAAAGFYAGLEIVCSDMLCRFAFGFAGMETMLTWIELSRGSVSGPVVVGRSKFRMMSLFVGSSGGCEICCAVLGLLCLMDAAVSSSSPAAFSGKELVAAIKIFFPVLLALELVDAVYAACLTELCFCWS
ncbi:hypothetical protein Nepgr_017386 [Nepenthes gracilis]|uniref:Uncharacterized protein n=1 Tax=Nepenthes gracilis TaxID=150966 RepID=A0AAD3SPB9_NEPGR|nr:hypothetical protein Nepgr_017386 [Nepenthes gracilis]